MNALSLMIPLLMAIGLPFAAQSAQTFPPIPASTRILTPELVKRCWINTLQARPIPSKPLGLHPELQAAWRSGLAARNGFIQAIRNGDYDIDAKLAELRHNAAAWRLQGNRSEAEAAEARILEITEYLARMETLAMQRRAAQAQIDSAERLRGIEAELAALRSSCCQ